MTDGFQIIGHRGAMGHAPENTLGSIRKALELGASGVEIDIRQAGGDLIVFHDETLARSTDGSGLIGDFALRELQQFDAGNGEHIPTLDEALDVALGYEDPFVNLELKSGVSGNLVRDALKSHTEAIDRILVSSYHDKLLAEVAESGVRLGCLFRGDGWNNARNAAHELDAFSIHPHHEVVTTDIASECKDHGWRVFPFTINDRATAERLAAMGADGIFTDYPDRFVDMIANQR